MTFTKSDKWNRLITILSGYDSAIVAFSGGVDSALLLKAAYDSIAVSGGNVLAVIGRSPSVPASEIKEAKALSEMIGATLRIIDTEEISDPRYQKNPPDRCYYCKTDLYGRLAKIAENENYSVVIDGTNLDDDGDYRPGRIAGEEFGVVAPLREAGLTKEDIRTAAKELNLPVWDKPQAACLASRITQNEPITIENLKRVELAEQYLKGLGFRQVRVRTHGDLARIETTPDKIESLSEETTRAKVTEHLKSIGFTYVTIDSSGYCYAQQLY